MTAPVRQRRATGPVEYLVVAFPDGNLSDEFALAVADLIDKKMIRLIDAVVIVKNTSGEVATVERESALDRCGGVLIGAAGSAQELGTSGRLRLLG